MKVTTYIAKFIESKGIDVLFELQGGMITRIIDEIHNQGKIKIVSVHHEQAASFAVDAYARVTNKPGIAFATSGPGATNLLTGIGNCYFDSVPAIFITGQVNINEQKGDSPIRQLGFQETDIVSIVKPITKVAFSVKKSDEIPDLFTNAYNIAMSGRMGPVLIDIPMNIQNEEIDIIESDSFTSTTNEKLDSNALDSFCKDWVSCLNNSKRPLILAGRGVRASGGLKQFRQFIERYQIPVVTSLLGIDTLEYSDPNRVGFIGTYGNRWANYALGTCDLLLVIGSRLDLRQTGADTEIFTKGKKIFHIDIDSNELNNRIKGCKILNDNLIHFLDFATNYKLNEIPQFPSWKREIMSTYKSKSDEDELTKIEGINPNRFIHLLSRASKSAKVITTDVGNNQMWAAQSYEISDEQVFLSSGGMGAMGYSLPAAIGACFASNTAPVISISGDGGFQLNIQELQTIKRNKLPIKIIIINNNCLGMIRQFQDSYFNSCYESTVWGYDVPDFELIAKSYGINSFTVKNGKDIEEGLKHLWRDINEPFLLNVFIDIHTNVYPKMLFGNPLTELDGEK